MSSLDSEDQGFFYAFRGSRLSDDVVASNSEDAEDAAAIVEFRARLRRALSDCDARKDEVIRWLGVVPEHRLTEQLKTDLEEFLNEISEFMCKWDPILNSVNLLFSSDNDFEFSEELDRMKTKFARFCWIASSFDSKRARWCLYVFVHRLVMPMNSRRESMAVVA